MDLLNWALLLTTAIYGCAAVAFTLGLARSSSLPCPDNSRQVGQDLPFVSVVVAARNEEAFLEDCLSGLVNQTYAPDRFEVLVVDDDSQDSTAEIAGRFATQYTHIRALSVGTQFPHMAAKKRPMSVGIHAARGELILTTDADCRVPPTWVAGMVACFTPGVDGVIGFSQLKSTDSPLSFFEQIQALDFLALMSASAGAANLGFPLAASGQNLAYRKSIFTRAGGFEPVAHRPSGGDVLLLQLMRKAGGHFVFSQNSDTFVSTWRSETPSGFWRQRKRWASNATIQYHLNPPFFAYIATVFLTNLLLPIALVAGLFGAPLQLPLMCALARLLADLCVTGLGIQIFRRTDLLTALPAWLLLQPVYIVLIGLAGTWSGFAWKGRQHR